MICSLVSAGILNIGWQNIFAWLRTHTKRPCLGRDELYSARAAQIPACPRTQLAPVLGIVGKPSGPNRPRVLNMDAQPQNCSHARRPAPGEAVSPGPAAAWLTSTVSVGSIGTA